MTSAVRLALTMVAHEVGTARRSNQRAVVKQRYDKLAVLERNAGALNRANPTRGSGGFGFGSGDYGGELGLVEMHGVSFSCYEVRIALRTLHPHIAGVNRKYV